MTSRLPVPPCSSCQLDLQHCHGTAIIIDTLIFECSDDPDCPCLVEEHHFIAFIDLDADVAS